MPNCWFWPYFVGAALLPGFLLLLFWLLHRSLLDRQARQLRRHMDASIDGITRRASESIDTLVQSVHGLILKVHGVATRMPAQESLRVMLDDAMTQAELMLADASERGRNLRTGRDERDLTAMLTALGEQLQSATGLLCTVITLGRPRRLSVGVGADLFAIGRVAMLNAFRHADASQVYVAVAYRRRALQVTISDDGSGLPPGAMRNGDKNAMRGLADMHARAVQSGARLRLRARNGGGSEWVLTLPAELAFATNWRRRWRWWRS